MIDDTKWIHEPESGGRYENWTTSSRAYYEGDYILVVRHSDCYRIFSGTTLADTLPLDMPSKHVLEIAPLLARMKLGKPI